MDHVRVLITQAINGDNGVSQAITDAHDEIILAVIAVLGTAVAGLVYAIKSYGQAKEANKAVNNIGPGEHRLYEVIRRIETKQDEFDRKWGNLPDDMDDAVGLVELLHSMSSRIDAMDKTLAEHVSWEMTVKYPSVLERLDSAKAP